MKITYLNYVKLRDYHFEEIKLIAFFEKKGYYFYIFLKRFKYKYVNKLTSIGSPQTERFWNQYCHLADGNRMRKYRIAYALNSH